MHDRHQAAGGAGRHQVHGRRRGGGPARRAGARPQAVRDRVHHRRGRRGSGGEGALARPRGGDAAASAQRDRAAGRPAGPGRPAGLPAGLRRGAYAQLQGGRARPDGRAPAGGRPDRDTLHGFPFHQFQSWPRRTAYIEIERRGAGTPTSSSPWPGRCGRGHHAPDRAAGAGPHHRGGRDQGAERARCA